MRRLALMAALQLGYVAERWDRLPQHVYFVGIINVLILFVVVELALRTRRVDVDRGQVIEGIARPARWFGALAFGAAGIAKLNTSFLDPQQSCATVLYQWQREGFPFWLVLPPDAGWTRWSAIVFTLLGQIGGPVLLWFRRTRGLGLIVVTAFLVCVATNAIGDRAEQKLADLQVLGGRVGVVGLGVEHHRGAGTDLVVGEAALDRPVDDEVVEAH